MTGVKVCEQLYCELDAVQLHPELSFEMPHFVRS